MAENESGPRISKNELYQLIRDERIDEFNQRWQHGERHDLRGLDWRSLDLRKLRVKNIDFSDGYFRGADLRGLDFRTCCLEGASIPNAKISGVYFPEELDAGEILMSLNHGTRMRCRKPEA